MTIAKRRRRKTLGRMKWFGRGTRLQRGEDGHGRGSEGEAGDGRD